jgi:transcriptional regulator with XRE-family HTH domain
VSPEQLRSLRKSIGTQEEVAQRLGLNRRTVGDYERRSAAPPEWYVLALEGLAAKQKSPDLAGPSSQS